MRKGSPRKGVFPLRVSLAVLLISNFECIGLNEEILQLKGKVHDQDQTIRVKKDVED